jgi:hypothetical protein
LFGKWNLPYCPAPVRNDSAPASAGHGEAWAVASSWTAMPVQFSRAFADPAEVMHIAAHSGVVIGITSGLKSAEYWCLTRALPLFA